MHTLLRDTGTVFARAMRMSLRNPAWLVISLLQPILYIVLFGPLLEPIAGQLGAGNAYQIHDGLLNDAGLQFTEAHVSRIGGQHGTQYRHLAARETVEV